MFEITQHRDNQKSEWCKKLNIPLHIISYLDNIEEKLEEIINGLDELDRDSVE